MFASYKIGATLYTLRIRIDFARRGEFQSLIEYPITVKKPAQRTPVTLAYAKVIQKNAWVFFSILMKERII